MSVPGRRHPDAGELLRDLLLREPQHLRHILPQGQGGQGH